MKKHMFVNANSLHIPLANQSVQMVATSPPYSSLRDYGVAGQIGMEGTPEAYVSNLVQVFREVGRVLKNDGVLWLNLGDSYAGSGKGPTGKNGIGNQTKRQGFDSSQSKVPDGLKPKDLIGIPWRVAFALQADGWYLRSDVIWSKPNPMPESVTDRPTKAHEYIFLLTKSQKYFYDAGAVLEPAAYDGRKDTRMKGSEKYSVPMKPGGGVNTFATEGHERWPQRLENGARGRNRRTVWNVPTYSYKGAHFATWPPALVEPMIKAGSRPGDVVLDPFAGSGTTGLVARQLGRMFVGLDLSFTYLHDCARVRMGDDKVERWVHGRV